MNHLHQYLKLKDRERFDFYIKKLGFVQELKGEYQLIFGDDIFYLDTDLLYLLKSKESGLYGLLMRSKKVVMDTNKDLTLLCLITTHLNYSFIFKTDYIYEVLTIDDKYFHFYSIGETLASIDINNLYATKLSDAIKLAWYALNPFYAHLFDSNMGYEHLLNEMMKMYPYSLQKYWVQINLPRNEEVNDRVTLIRNCSHLEELEKKNRKLYLLEDDGCIRIPVMAVKEFGLDLTLDEKMAIGRSIVSSYCLRHGKKPEKKRRMIDGQEIDVCQYTLRDYHLIYEEIKNNIYNCEHMKKLNLIGYRVIDMEMNIPLMKALYDHYGKTDYFDEPDFKVIYTQKLFEIIDKNLSFSRSEVQNCEIYSDDDDSYSC